MTDTSDAQSWYLLGRCYISQQKYPKAYEAYQQAVYRDGRNPTFWCSIGVLYYQINQYRDALDAYSRAIRLNPYISEVWYDLGTLVSTPPKFDPTQGRSNMALCSMNLATIRSTTPWMRTRGRRSSTPVTRTSRRGCSCCAVVAPPPVPRSPRTSTHMLTSQLLPHRALHLRRGARPRSSRLRGRLRVPLPRHRRMVGAAMAMLTPLPSRRTRTTSSAPTRTEAKRLLPIPRLSNGNPARGKNSSCASSSSSTNSSSSSSSSRLSLLPLPLRPLPWPSRLSHPMGMLGELTPESRLRYSTGGLLALTLCRALRRRRRRRRPHSRCT